METQVLVYKETGKECLYTYIMGKEIRENKTAYTVPSWLYLRINFVSLTAF